MSVASKILLGLVVIILLTSVLSIITNKQNSMPKTPNSIKSSSLKITSSAFNDNSSIPSKYTCDGIGVNPPLSISGVPESAKSLALIVDDPDAPTGLWIHWVAWNIDPKTKLIPEGIQTIGVNGLNTRGKALYVGPCPPDKEHRYFFKLFALDKELNLPPTSGANELIKAMTGHIVDQAEFIGLYDRRR